MGQPLNDQTSIQALRNGHAGQTAWIIGKGPSLARLSHEHLGPGPVIALNEAIVAVEALGLDNRVYSLQKDADEYDPAPDLAAGSTPRPGSSLIAPVQRATLLVHRHESVDRAVDYSPRYVFDNVADFGLKWFDFSALTAIAIAKLMGCSKVICVSFDACVFGDCRTWTAAPNGVSAVDPIDEAYVGYCRKIEEYVAELAMTVQWLTPERDNPADPRLLVTRLRAELDESRRTAQRFRVTADAAKGEVERLSEALAPAQNDIRRLTAGFEQTAADLEQYMGMLAEAHSRESSVRGDLEAARGRIDELLASASWRWMAPVRAVYRLLARSK